MKHNVKVIRQRRGVALMAAIVTMVILSLMMSAIAWQIIACGRVLQHREYELEAESLARAGIEFAAARVLENPESYQEVLEPIERASVTIEVRHEPSQPDTYRISCMARY